MDMWELIKREWQIWAGAVLLGLVMNGFNGDEQEQSITKQAYNLPSYQTDKSLQSVVFESDIRKRSVGVSSTPVVGEPQQTVVLPEELKFSGYCQGHCEPNDQILQMALQDPINRLPVAVDGKTINNAQQKGRFARVQFYMHERYNLPWQKEQLEIMCRWSSSSPVDGWELSRNRELVAMGGVANPFVDMPDQVTLRCGQSV